jgi:hypothetical protein
MRWIVVLGALLVLAGGACGNDGPDKASEVRTIEVVGPPEAGSGEIPHFEWEVTSGVDEYGVVVRDADGATIWAWRGETEEIWFGGTSRQRPAGMAGPTVEAGSTWRVVGYDDDGHVVAISAEHTLDP